MTDKTDSKEREAFERAYAEAWHAASSPRKESIDELQYEVSTWREGDSYPDDLPRLRFGWEWWKARASLAANADGCQHESDGCTYTSIPPKNRCKKCGAVYTLGGPQAANAGSEPVAWPKDATEVREFFRSDFIRAEYVADDHQPCDEDRYYISAHDFLSAINWWADFPHHPSPPEGMVGGWISVDERLPPPFEEVVVYPRPDDYCCEAFCDTAGNWKWAEYEHNFGVHHRGCQVEYWLMLPEVPAPPTSSADSSKEQP